MTPFFRLSCPALLFSLLAGAANAATIRIDFTAELLGQRSARYITGYDRDGDPRYARVGGLFQDFAVGQDFSGQIEFSGDRSDFAALMATGKVNSWSTDMEADCSIGPVACDATEFSLRAPEPLRMRATLFADFGDTSFDFVIGRRNDRLRVVQILGGHGGLQDGERDYLARFSLDEFGLAAAAERAAAPLPVVPAAPAAPLLAAALAALVLLRRRMA